MFAIRLRPAGLAVLSTLRAADLADAAIPLTSRLDDRLHDLMARVARGGTPEARARAADELIAARRHDNPAPAAHILSNRILDELRSRVYHRTGTPLAEHFAVSERTIQRALAATLGHRTQAGR